MSGRKSSPQSPFSFLTQDFSMKLIAVLIAVFLFFTHRLSLFREKQFTLPLRVLNRQNYIITNPHSTRIRVRIKDREEALQQLLKDDLQAYVDLKESKKAGTYTFPVRLRHLNRPELLKNKEIILKPESLTLRLSRSATKQVPVQADIETPPSDDYRFSYEISPQKVVIRGPSERIRSLREIKTTPLDLSVFRESFRLPVRPVSPDPLIRIIDTKTVQFTGTISEKIETKNIDSLKILSVDLPPRFEIVAPIPALKVIVQGSKRNLKKLVLSSLYGTVDGSLIEAPGRYTLPVSVKAPDGILILDYSPQTLTLLVRRQKGGRP